MWKFEDRGHCTRERSGVLGAATYEFLPRSERRQSALNYLPPTEFEALRSARLTQTKLSQRWSPKKR